MDESLHILDPADTLDGLKEYFFAPYITLAHVFNAPKNWKIKPRTLSQHQFQYVMEGVAKYRIGDRTYVTKRGDLIYHGPKERHSVHTVDGHPYICLSVVFHFGTVSFPLQELIGTENYLGNFAHHPIENKLSQLVAHYHQPGLWNHTLCQGLLMQIIGELAAWRESRPQSKVQEKTKAKIVLLRNYITQHYNRKLTLKELEQISNLSRNYIIAQFKKTYGMTPFDFLTWVRIEKAKELVIQTHLSISEIAQQVGYADVHTFGRMFKHKTGMSLSQFCSSLVIR